MKIVATKEIWDVSNPLPCVRIAPISDFTDGFLLVDWEKWVDYVNYKTRELRIYNLPFDSWIAVFCAKIDGCYSSHIDYEASLQNATQTVISDFISWL